MRRSRGESARSTSRSGLNNTLHKSNFQATPILRPTPLQAERETRRKLLLQRARERDGLPPEPQVEQQPEQALVPAKPAAQPFSLFSPDDLTADNSEACVLAAHELLTACTRWTVAYQDHRCVGCRSQTR